MKALMGMWEKRRHGIEAVVEMADINVEDVPDKILFKINSDD